METTSLKMEAIDEETVKKFVQDEAMKLPDMNIAISGMAGRFPKADSINEFEQHLYNGVDMITDQDNSRFECGLWGLPPRAGRLKDLSKFDCEFFGFTLEEANYIDFQLRILYEVVYECIIDAGLNPSDLRGTNTGVFFGLHCNEFENALADDPNFKSNGYYAQFAVKIAQYFDFRGLNITFDAACASGFVGLHNAVQAINDGLIDRAIVCSSNIPIHPTGSFVFLQMQMLSPTGYSRFLDSRADGYVKSESCVSMLIQRKDLALRNYGSFMATMTSVDGFKQEGITFPSATSQEELIKNAKILAGLSTNHIEYLEAHGTGTPAGDPQESRAISNVYFPSPTQGDDKSEKLKQQQEERIIGPLLVGSVKTNMGHSEAASGLCALTKVALMLENEIIYPGLHYEQPNGNIDSLKEGKLKFVDNRRHLNGKIIPLSCYGFGGANVHAIVRANHKPRIEQELDGNNLTWKDDDKPRLIIMFGRNEQALNYFFDRLLDTESRETRNCLSEDFLTLVDTINSSKIDRLMNYRGYLVVDRRSGKKELKREIQKCELKAPKPTKTTTNDDRDQQQQQNETKLISSSNYDSGRQEHYQECIQRSCNLILPGIGCQWPAMADGLREYKSFWSTIERLSVIMEPFEFEFNLIAILTDENQYEAVSQSMAQTFVAIIAYEVALINIIRDQIQLNNVKNIIGHSLGEISCAYAVGLLSEREAIILAYRMGKVLDSNRHLIEGKMLAIGISEENISKRLSKYNTIQVCCLNGSQSITVSGSNSEIDQLNSELSNDPNIFVKLIDCPIALHNEKIMTHKIKQLLKEGISKVLFELADYKRNSKGWISSISSSSSSSSSITDTNNLDFNQANADYFAHSLCTKVDFKNAIEQLDEDSIVIELGPGGAFESQIRQIKCKVSSSDGKPKANKFHYVKMMKQMTPKENQVLELTKSFGQIYLNGGTFKNLSKFHQSLSQQQSGEIDNRVHFPVKRQTPSLSSLFKWNHEQDLFVPRYPKQFSKSSAKSELPIDIIQDRDKYIAGHCIEGRILYPATGYLFLIWRIFSFTKRQVYDACFQDVEKQLMPIEFRDVKLFRAVMLGSRTSQIYVHLEEATGKFEVKEGGSVCAEGYALTPSERPDDLLYNQVRDDIKNENLELVLSSDDVYKQFRLSGYDYGETFRNIIGSSADGRYCRIKYSGHFVAFSDSILQSIFLAVSQYAPSGGLFLPTGFEYARFQPEIILSKLYEAKMIFDKTEGSLDTAAKREAMTKMMERESGIVNKQHETKQEQQQQQQQGEEGEKIKGENNDDKDVDGEKKVDEPECIFEVFCDPVSGIIVTDGIEMRGIKATPAPRRSYNNEVLLESYQFVKDIEDPIDDENLTRFKHSIDKYSKVCDAMSIHLLAKLYGKSMNEIEKMFDLKNILNENQINVYLEAHLINLYKNFQDNYDNSNNNSTVRDNDNDDDENDEKKSYDIKKNGNQVLMSVIDQLLTLDNPKIVKEIIHKNRIPLMQDLIQTSFLSERIMRPLIELVIENTCFKKMKLKLMEVNNDDGLIVEPVQQLIQRIEPKLSLDYSLAHPDLNKLTANKLLTANNQLKTYTMRDLPSLFCDNQIKDLDLLMYKDISCYSLPKQVIEKNGLAPVLTSLNEAVKLGGYIMVLLRQQLTLAERILISMSEPELVGLTKKDLEIFNQGYSDKQTAIVDKINHINEILNSRCELMIKEAAKNEMIFVSKKSDLNGCTVLLFKTTRKAQVNSQDNVDANYALEEKTKNMVLLRVSHENKDKISEWLEKLKDVFKKSDEKSTEKISTEQETENKLLENGQSNKEVIDGKELEVSKEKEKEEEVEVDEEEEEEQKAKKQKAEERQVWLCAVQTKQNPISGLIGLMQCLKRELGSARLRCYYDCYTFKNQNEPISLSAIRESANFNESLKRNHIWNCIDSSGNFGSFRHFTLDKYMSYDDCLCNSIENKNCDNIITTTDDQQFESGKKNDRVEAYINVNNRGDLSSFTWFEAPHKYLNEEDKSSIVKVSYSALNFRDIMIATGRLPLDSLPLSVALSDCLLGLEFSGIDAKGRRVMCMVPNRGIATHVVCPKSKSINVEIPDWLNLREAATIPAVYATAIMSLICRGRMKTGESVLIHAASGGVGQAAIRLCIHHKLIIFATVGTEEKRKFLLEEFGEYLSDDRIFSSRDCKFEESIMRATHGRGVDLILNSLADDKLQASIRCLADGGRFLEIGKYDLAMNSKLELFKLDTNKSFHGILLDKMFDENDYHAESYKRQLRTVKEILEDGLKEGYIKPIKYTLFKKHQVEEAFRFMATGKHIGKILIEIESELENSLTNCNHQQRITTTTTSQLQKKNAKEEECVDNNMVQPTKFVPKFQLSPEKSYIVTGGLGGFGLELTKWLVKQGAKFLLLTSRSGVKTGYQKVTLERMIRNDKAEVLVVDNSIADTTNEIGARRLLKLAQKMSPIHEIGGIFHLAMVLKDTLIENMTPEDFEIVLKPKVDTFVHLDNLTRKMDLNLDYFVAFSSVTSGKGNTGQGNYGYANSCVERICEKRREDGRHGLAIQWGAIGDVGVAFESLGGNDIVIGGTIPQRMPSCFNTLSKILCSPFAICLSILPQDKNRSGDSQGEKRDLVDAIMHVLGIKDASKVSDQATLGELGLDSLMAVEIRQYIEREYDMTLNIQEIRALTIAKIKEINDK